MSLITSTEISKREVEILINNQGLRETIIHIIEIFEERKKNSNDRSMIAYCNYIINTQTSFLNNL